MPISAGTRLGPYEILAPLGAGGMGEVYRARDPRLNRFIAIKILPGHAAMDADRRERFQREAHAIAALNHPNIVTIYSTEEIDGHAVLTMELIEGRSLAEAIPKGGLPLDRLLPIAIAVADAVATAHQKGITHRDLKPANIMLGQGEQEGRVKVLDFGLARLADTATGTSGATSMPTTLVGAVGANPLTAEGRILGTVAYMSPEQAEGKTVDARSDLFSLGVVLYEMATGRRPFTGDTSISVISSIVKDTPKPVTELNVELPHEIGRIIRHALTKDPERRYQTAKDLRNDLEELKRSLDTGELAAHRSGTSVRGGATRGWQWAALGLALVSVATIAAIVVLLRSGPDSPVSSAPTPQIEMIRLTNSGTARLPALSPDGKFVAYVEGDSDKPGDQPSVWVRQIASGSATRIVPPAPATQIRAVAFTPDGSFIDFVKGETNRRNALWRVPVLGGTPRKLVDQAGSAPGWSPDGKQMAFLANAPSETHVVVAEADGSQPRVIATRKLPQRYPTVTFGSRPDLRPMWLPDGRTIAVIGLDGTVGIADLVLLTVSVAGGAETTLLNLGGYGLSSWMGMAAARDGRSFILNRTEPDGPQQLVRLHLPTGDTTRLTNDLSTYSGASLAGDAVVASRLDSRSSLWLTDAAGKGARQIGQDIPTRLEGMAWAGNGRVINFAVLAGGMGLWSTDVSGGAPELIVPGGGFFFSTTGDGRTLVYVRRRENTNELWRSDADGTHATQIATGGFTRATVTPDGSAVLYLWSKSGVQNLWMIDIRGGAPRQLAPFLALAAGLAASPDGRLVMIRSIDEQTRLPETRIIPITGGEPVRRLRTDQVFRRWAPDGRGLAYVDPSGLNVWVQPLEGGAPRQLTHFTDGPPIVEFAWSPDGQQLALTRAIDTSDIVMLKGIK
ncbi:MAG: protein kinase domain-containing protein [Vicinamibacterales bacterium]